MASVKKPTLRELAVAAGLAKPNDLKLFQMDIDALIDVLKPEFPGIEELDEDGVLDLINKTKKGGGKGSKDEDDATRGRGRASEKDEDAPRGRGRSSKDEEKEEPRGRGRGAKDEEKDDAPRGRGRGSEKDEKDDAPRGRGRAKESEEKEEPRGRGRGAEKDEDAPRGRGRAKDEEKEPAKDDAPRGRGRGRGDEKDEEKDEAPRGRGRGRSEEKEESKDAGSGGDVVKLLAEVLAGQAEIGKRLEAVEKSIGELDAKVDAADTNTSKVLKGLKAQLAEVHVGVESIYLDDISKKDQSLADVLKRVSD